MNGRQDWSTGGSPEARDGGFVTQGWRRRWSAALRAELGVGDEGERSRASGRRGVLLESRRGRCATPAGLWRSGALRPRRRRELCSALSAEAAAARVWWRLWGRGEAQGLQGCVLRREPLILGVRAVGARRDPRRESRAGDAGGRRRVWQVGSRRSETGRARAGCRWRVGPAVRAGEARAMRAGRWRAG
jgi:hypothetical protein